MYVMDTRRIRKRIQELNNSFFVSGVLMDEVAKKTEQGISSNKRGIADHVSAVGKFCQENGKNPDKDRIILEAVISPLVKNPELQAMIPDNICDRMIDNGKVFKQIDFENNPYCHNVHCPEKRVGNFRISHRNFKEYEPFIYNCPDMQNGVFIQKIGCFDHEYSYPVLEKYNGNDWSKQKAVTPFEIIAMEESIKAASGNVLTIGCGLGYFAYMAALKDDVSKVTIIEKSPEIIELFTSEILPQFSVKDKIEIIEANAMTYIRNLDDGVFDFCFADLWHDDRDYLPYLKLKKICSKFSTMSMSYWREASIVLSAIDNVTDIMIEACDGINYAAQDYIKLPESDERMSEAFKEILADVRITKPEQIDFFLDWKNIAQLLGRNKSDC